MLLLLIHTTAVVKLHLDSNDVSGIIGGKKIKQV